MSLSCRTCGETIEPPLDVCWQCGTDRLGNTDPEFSHADSYFVAVDAKSTRFPFRFSIAGTLLLTAVISLLMALFHQHPMVLLILAVLATPLMIFWILLFAYSIIYAILHRNRPSN